MRGYKDSPMSTEERDGPLPHGHTRAVKTKHREEEALALHMGTEERMDRFPIRSRYGYLEADVLEVILPMVVVVIIVVVAVVVVVAVIM